MTWFKMDDSAYDHPKVVGLSDGAFRLWVCAGLYCSRHLTDGIVAPGTLRVLQAKQRYCDELWAAGLWEPLPEGGYRYHDWGEYQPLRAEVEARRKANRDRVAKHRSRKTGRFEG